MTDYIAQTLTPDNVLAMARGEVELTKEELMHAEHLIKEFVRPGDLIMTRTPSKIFGTLRELGGTDYDHLIAVIDKDRSLHVSYPFAKLAPTSLFV